MLVLCDLSSGNVMHDPVACQVAYHMGKGGEIPLMNCDLAAAAENSLKQP